MNKNNIRILVKLTVSSPLCLSGMLEKLSEMSAKLEEIQKALDMYLETKRQIFPRFYFLSNDDVLEILGQSQNPKAMQPHLKKCFDNIRSLCIEKAQKLDNQTHTYTQLPLLHFFCERVI